MTERICSKCGKSKPETEEFFRRRGTKDRGGLRPDCRECSTARDRAYYAANTGKHKAKCAAYRAANKAKIKAREAAYMATPEGRATRMKHVRRYNQSEAGRLAFVLAAHRRRARIKQVRNDFTAEDWFDILTSFGAECAYCGSTVSITQDHVKAIAVGGPNTKTNVVPACGSCNSRKFVTDMQTWYRAQSFFDAARLDRILTHTLAEVA